MTDALIPLLAIDGAAVLPSSAAPGAALGSQHQKHQHAVQNTGYSVTVIDDIKSVSY